MANYNRNQIKTAVLIDGSFFLKRYRCLYENGGNHSPEEIVINLNSMIRKHIADEYLYRVFYYDCPPFDQKIYNPYTNKTIDFNKSETAIFRKNFFNELKKQRKFALRLGKIRQTRRWILKPDTLKDVLQEKTQIEELTDNDFVYDLQQKGVDIKIGIDIASLAIQRMVNKIILISGDSDFVPAAKLARRNGIDFLLDPMWNPIRPDLFEHIDGLQSNCPKPQHMKE